MADLPPTNAFAPIPGKIEMVENIFKNYTYQTVRPFYMANAQCSKTIDNSAFIMFWLSLDVLTYFDYEYVTPTTIYQNLKTLDRNIYEGSINTNYDFWIGDVIFLSTDSDFTSEDSEKYYIGIWWTKDSFISFDINGYHKKSLDNLLSDYPIFTNMSVFRI